MQLKTECAYPKKALVAFLEKVKSRPGKSDRPVSGQKKVARRLLSCCKKKLILGVGMHLPLRRNTAAPGRKTWAIEVNNKRWILDRIGVAPTPHQQKPTHKVYSGGKG